MLKKGMKVWFVGMNDQATFDVVQGTVAQNQTDGECVMVRYSSTRDGVTDSIVADRRPTEVFRARPDAIKAAAALCRRAAAKHTAQADRLLTEGM